MVHIEGSLARTLGRHHHWLELDPAKQHPQALIPEGHVLHEFPYSPDGEAAALQASGGRPVRYIQTRYPFNRHGTIVTHGPDDGTHGFGAGPLPKLDDK